MCARNRETREAVSGNLILGFKVRLRAFNVRCSEGRLIISFVGWCIIGMIELDIQFIITATRSR